MPTTSNGQASVNGFEWYWDADSNRTIGVDPAPRDKNKVSSQALSPTAASVASHPQRFKLRRRPKVPTVTVVLLIKPTLIPILITCLSLSYILTPLTDSYPFLLTLCLPGSVSSIIKPAHQTPESDASREYV